MTKFSVLSALFLMSSAALAAVPAGSVAAPGHLGVGVGGGTAVSGISAKYYLADAFAVQGVAGGAGYARADYGSSSLGLSGDLLWEMPVIATVDGAFDVAWSAGVGGWAWVGDPTWLGASGVLGMELRFIPIPLDFVVEYRPSVRLIPDVGVNVFDLGAHLRFYFQ